MIVLDTSALIAILKDEPEAGRCLAALSATETILISAGTLSEIIIVSERLGVAAAVDDLLAGLQAEIVPVTAEDARQMGAAYRQWGKGLHPAGLNFGDCFAYVLAKTRGCPLLFVGTDFSRTDIEAA
ncbi:type II toxin-antitoxin system VapC family toxin [Acidisoma silvae]|uniref:Ribonuclease VapC n=1 Tax=Acidisoma silvae TaxID=2802396 RepID=A0A964E032_9PROT|nr:type II toxin-antitoxin system VapC family toxin [Acidisoma silvae]MCB8876288.1 type II toxin-antitoxin system VapC family toxin [Acidisoma silvae]